MIAQHVQLTLDFAQKAKVNSEFVLAAVKGMGRDALAVRGSIPTMGLQPANQLVAEGIELLLKALVLARGGTPAATHNLVALFDSLEGPDKETVKVVADDSIACSATGALPYGLPNVASAVLVGNAPLGEPDPTGGYGDLDVRGFLRLLYQQWAPQRSQYLGADTEFAVGTTLRANSRLRAGALLFCEGLAERCIKRFKNESAAARSAGADRPSAEQP